jgi:hypothetical protein
MLPIYLGLFLIAGSILSLEIALTRVFAIMMWHHLAYMVISVAMLGFGAQGPATQLTVGIWQDKSNLARLAAL